MVLDIRALRACSSWTPHWGYGLLGVLPVLGTVVKEVAVVSIPVAIGYLALRRRRVGAPFGSGVTVDTASPSATKASPIPTPTTRWWYGVVIPPVLEVTGLVGYQAFRTTGVLRQGSEPLTLLAPMAFIVIAIALVPLFAISLYKDAKALRGTSNGPSIDPRVWGAVGLVSLVGIVVVRISFMPIIAIAYLVRRRLANRR